MSWFAILFTGNIPQGMFDFMAAVLRYQWRTYTYMGFMRESYPPFEFTATNIDPGNDPGRLSVAHPERLSRLLIFVKWLLVIPHLFALMFVGIGAFFVGIAGFSPSSSPGGGPRACGTSSSARCGGACA